MIIFVIMYTDITRTELFYDVTLFGYIFTPSLHILVHCEHKTESQLFSSFNRTSFDHQSVESRFWLKAFFTLIPPTAHVLGVQHNIMNYVPLRKAAAQDEE